MSVLSSRVMLVFGMLFLTAWSGTCGAGALKWPRAAQPGPMNPPPVTMTAQQDRQNMLDQLKIPAETIRRGPSGWDPKAPDFQNIDEEKANPWPHLPEMMVTKNRRLVDAPETWWKVRRPEIVDYFDAEIYGRVPKEVPKVTWEVDKDGKAGFGFGKGNRGQPRKPDDWGALRAWAWGASRALDYLETDKDVDAKQVGISGLSRYGKAAIVAMAYEPRFAIGLIGSSGAGGAKLLRRNWGEQVENLCSSGGYHWMAGNFLKYAGPLAPCDLPVDAHELIALCAPRPTFISYGASTGPGAEGYWVDQKGSFMAAVAAGPAWKLLGKKDLGTTEMPAVGASLVDGELAWRMHSGGHTTGPNIETFVTWASRYIKAPPVKESAKLPAARVAAETVKPIARTDANSRKAHEQLLEKAKKGRIDLYFAGDSITRRWGAT
ncbi:MAG TPA: hypothetical protein VLM40_17390, partial [Gemmata sp.]|nr:hypothetical protein [Gemmata sp.]